MFSEAVLQRALPASVLQVIKKPCMTEIELHFSCAHYLQIPSGLACPITGLLLLEPVVCCDGHTYERAAISKWFAERRSRGLGLTSPLTNAPLVCQACRASQ